MWLFLLISLQISCKYSGCQQDLKLVWQGMLGKVVPRLPHQTRRKHLTDKLKYIAKERKGPQKIEERKLLTKKEGKIITTA